MRCERASLKSKARRHQSQPSRQSRSGSAPAAGRKKAGKRNGFADMSDVGAANERFRFRDRHALALLFEHLDDGFLVTVLEVRRVEILLLRLENMLG